MIQFCLDGDIKNLKKNILLRKTIRIEELELGFLFACENGHGKIVKYLLNIAEQYSGKKINIHKNNEEIFKLVCKKRYIKIMRFLLKISYWHDKEIDIHIDNEECFRTACEYGHLDVVKYLLKISNKKTYTKIDIYEYGRSDDMVDEFNGFDIACQNGHLHILIYLISITWMYKDNTKLYLPDLFEEFTYLMLTNNCIHLNIIRYFLEEAENDIRLRNKIEHDFNSIINIHDNDEYYFRRMISNGHIQIIKYLINLYKINNKYTPIDITKVTNCEELYLSYGWIYYPQIETYLLSLGRHIDDVLSVILL